MLNLHHANVNELSVINVDNLHHTLVSVVFANCQQYMVSLVADHFSWVQNRLSIF